MLLKYIIHILFFVSTVEPVPQRVPNVKHGLEAPCYGGEQLIVFVNSAAPILDTEDMAALQKLAAEIAAELKVKDIAEGAPPEVTYTPSIVYQNAEGRSFYYGRYKKMSRIKNFVRARQYKWYQQTLTIHKHSNDAYSDNEKSGYVG